MGNPFYNSTLVRVKIRTLKVRWTNNIFNAPPSPGIITSSNQTYFAFISHLSQGGKRYKSHIIDGRRPLDISSTSNIYPCFSLRMHKCRHKALEKKRYAAGSADINLIISAIYFSRYETDPCRLEATP